MTRIPHTRTRADAVRNRRHIVTVARAAFADQGIDLPVREVAERAGLGAATVYRHFPTRADLVAAALAEHVAECRAEMRAALADPDAWRALSGTIRRFAAHQLTDRKLNDALFGSHAMSAQFAEDYRAQAKGLDHLIERAGQAGTIRAGLTARDVRAGLAAITSLRALPPDTAANSASRLVNLLLAGMSA